MANDSSIQINIYRSAGVWYGALWINGEYDSCDELPCDDDASEAAAIECAEQMPLTVDGARIVTRVADVSEVAS